MNAAEAATATIMANGYGETPIWCAAPSAMSAINTAVAVLEINSPVTAHRINRLSSIICAPAPPYRRMSRRTKTSTPPVFSSASANGIMPTIRMRLGQWIAL